MALTAGARLGPYEIVSALGAGGMGEVYRARDTKLGRVVAVKILPDAVSSDPDRIARFEREAKVLASLNHPNIAALYGMDHHDERHLLVMELVEGETLADRVNRGALPIDEALAVAVQIAEALESAHEQGVVHRDLKPANVKITQDGKVKVLDFGLAKAMETAPAAANVANSPTLSMMATQAGIILGTAAYMSPEQAKGALADQRSDVFSFGVVLYEMLTGRQPFHGDTAPEVMANVLLREVDFTTLPPTVHPRLPGLVKRCLEKQPKKRWHAIGDVRSELEAIAAAPAGEPKTAAVPSAPLWRRLAPIVAALLLTAAIAGFVAWRIKPTPAQPVMRFPIVLTEGDRLGATTRRQIAVSPDGSRMAMVLFKENTTSLAIRRLDEMAYHVIAGTSNLGAVASPLFSPNGEWLAFWSAQDTSIKKVSIAGGSPITLCSTPNPLGMTWQDGAIVFAQGGTTNKIFRVSENGGEPELLVDVESPYVVYGPQLINQGTALLYSRTTSQDTTRWDTAEVVVQPLGSKEETVAVRGGSDARYLPTGHLVYAAGSTLLAVQFDEKSATVRGGPVPVVEGVSRPARSGGSTGVAQYAVSDNGVLVYVGGNTLGTGAQLTLTLAGHDGTVEQLPLPPRGYSLPRISPDGKRVAFVADEGRDAQVWVYALGSGGPARRLTFGGANTWPIWTPDGRFITFQSDRDGSPQIYQLPADGSGTAEPLTRGEKHLAQVPESWSPDGKTLLYRVVTPASQTLWTMSIAGDRTPQLFAAGEKGRTLVAASFAPDGRWVAYGANDGRQSGYFVFVEPFPRTGARYQVTTTPTSTPAWSRDGRQLYFAFTDRVSVTDIRTTPEFRFTEPVALKTEGSLASTQTIRNYDVMPDGKRLLLVAPPRADDGSAARHVPQLNVVINWFEELNTKVPVK